jgi:hypothetical protein
MPHPDPGLATGALAHPGPGLLLAAAAVFALAGAVKGIVGLGLPTVAMALLALRMPPAEAAALLIVPSLATNVWQLRPLATLWPLLRRLWPLQAGACAGTLAAGAALGAPAGAWATGALGAVLVAYAAWSGFGRPRRLPVRAQRLGAPVVGACTGVVTAATGVFVVPAVPWLQALGLERDALIQAMGLSFTCSTAALAASLGLGGHWSAADAGLSAALLAPALLGMWAGQRIRRRLAPAVFRRCFLGGLAGLGLYLLAGAAAGR